MWKLFLFDALENAGRKKRSFLDRIIWIFVFLVIAGIILFGITVE